jgi:glycosyltransferase involved in cell wall biosynthesis
MRILIDLQGAQSARSSPEIRRHALSLALALVRYTDDHELWIVLDTAFPERISEIRQAFAGQIPPQRICLFERPPAAENPASKVWQEEAVALVREHFLAQLRPDAILVFSLFEVLARQATVSVGKTAVMLYEPEPVLKSAGYLMDRFDGADQKAGSLKHAALVLTLSEYARRALIEVGGLAEDRVFALKPAVDTCFQPRSLGTDEVNALRKRFGITRKVVLCALGDGERTLSALMGAFASLASRAAYQLVVVGRFTADERLSVQMLGGEAGLDLDELILAGDVSAADQVVLYNLATLFVFVTFQEGGGLTVLEAIASGAPTLASNTGSVSEMIGFEGALFDPVSQPLIAEKMERALGDELWRLQLREQGLQLAGNFSWDSAAHAVISAFEARYGGAAPHREPALPFTPWPWPVEDYRQSCRDLIAAIAELSPSDPDDNDLQSLAASMARNFEQLEHRMRSTKLPERIAWRVEGPFNSSYSLALLNRETALALEALGHEVVLQSTEGPGDAAQNDHFLLGYPVLERMYRKASVISQEMANVTSRNTYPPRVDNMAGRLNMLHHYAWEESGFLPDAMDNFNEHLQGITCLSRHVQKIMVDNGATVPLMTSCCGVDHCDRYGVDPSFKINAKEFCFLHISSCFPRKGADVLLKAYGQSFSAVDPVTLVIKTFPNPHNEIHKWLAEAQRMKQDYPSVLIIEDDLSDAQVMALYRQCQALVAPSRAEGFGLPLAEAMLSGLPVITTGWGGQLDFCTPDTAWLVDFSFTPAETHFGLFNSVWAEPDATHLAQTMREVYALAPAVRGLKSAAGRDLLMRRFKWKDVAERLVAAARQWSVMPSPPKPRIGWISTWNTRCGIAAYSAHLVGNLPDEVTILAPHTTELTTLDGPNVLRCWRVAEGDTLQKLSQSIEDQNLDTLVIQFNYGFFAFGHFSKFLTSLVNAGKIVVVMMHSTSDPSYAPGVRLVQLADALSRCQRVLVHSPNDLNRLKAIGLVDNVAIFPHGLLDRPSTGRKSGAAPFTISSYGFFMRHKGFPELIEAFALLIEAGRDVRLKMINAAYPGPESAALVEAARNRVAELKLTHVVQIVSDFLPDDESLNRLSATDLIIFPYQYTGESSSAAVRYGLATGRPVAVTPLAIFDDVNHAVFRLPGESPVEMARGIGQLIDDIGRNSEQIVRKQAEADRWRDAHRYSRLGTRLYGILCALVGIRDSEIYCTQQTTGLTHTEGVIH